MKIILETPTRVGLNTRMSNTNRTEEQTRRIVEAIKDCDRYIAIESPRSEDLRPQKTKELLASYIAHRAKLQNVLDNNIPTPAMA